VVLQKDMQSINSVNPTVMIAAGGFLVSPLGALLRTPATALSLTSKVVFCDTNSRPSRSADVVWMIVHQSSIEPFADGRLPARDVSCE
jgi:hypothetical protein